MRSTCGREKKSDALVTVDLNADGIIIEIVSKLKDMFGESMQKAVKEALNELNIQNAKVEVKDYGALDFVIKARTKTAARRAVKQRGICHE